MISIVVPVYKAQDFIAETIRMVCAQTYEDWELLLVDDASPDGSRAAAEEEILRHPDRRIRLLPLEKNGGAAAARNYGVSKAQGRYIAFLDADDLWHPEKLERELAFMQEKNAAFACHSYEFGDENGKGTGRYVRVLPDMTYRQALTRTIIFTSTVMFDLEKLSKEQIRMPACESEDTALWWELLRTGVHAYGLDEVLAVYRRPRVSLSSDKGRAVRRIWYLYREREKLSVPRAALCFAGWAFRAAARRL